jgi:putative transcriptional regulator
MVGVSRNTISSIETGQFSPTAKLALVICIALEKKFEDLFFFLDEKKQPTARGR